MSARVTVCVPDSPMLVHLRAMPSNVDIEIVRDEPAPLPDLGAVDMLVPDMRIRPRLLELLAGPPGRLRVIQTLSAGVDWLAGRVPPHVAVHNARGIYEAPLAEWVVGAILAMQRGHVRARDAQTRAEWAFFAPDELGGRRVVILGIGSIGTAIADRLRPFGVDIVGVGRSERPGVRAMADLDELLPTADILVAMLPLTRETAGILDGRRLGLLPAGALVVNAGRGLTIDTDALTRELGSGRLRAALDVVDPEPLPPEHPLWALPNVLISPHMAGNSPSTAKRCYELVGDQIRRFAAGEPLLYEVPAYLLR